MSGWRFQSQPRLTPAQYAESKRAFEVLDDEYPGQVVAFIDEWDGDKLKRVVVAASADPEEFQVQLARIDPALRPRVDMTSVPDPAWGFEVRPSWFPDESDAEPPGE